MLAEMVMTSLSSLFVSLIIVISLTEAQECQPCGGTCLTYEDDAGDLAGDWTLGPGQDGGGSCWDGGCIYVNSLGEEKCFCFIQEGGEVEHLHCSADANTTTTMASTTQSCPTGEGQLSVSCPQGWSQIQLKCYKLVEPTLTLDWDGAKDDCIAKGGKLAAIESQCEQLFAFSLSNGAATWLGGSDLSAEGTFVWETSGATFYTGGAAVAGVYTNFEPGQPASTNSDNQDCLGFRDSTGTWDDILCTKTQQHLCQMDAYSGAATATTPAFVTEACASSCDSGWTRVGCQCYRVEQAPLNWTEAQTSCQGLKTSANLATISSSELEQELLDLAGGADTANEFWTGGSDIDDDATTFVWAIDNAVFWEAGPPIVHTGYENWFSSLAATQPNHATGQDCVKMKLKMSGGVLTRMGWDDVNCAATYKYACQYSVSL